METMAAEYWLDDAAWAAIEPLLPRNQPGARRVDDRRVISSIMHVLRSGCRWEDYPAIYGPPTTIYNRWNRWSARGLWMRIFHALARRLDGPALDRRRHARGRQGLPQAQGEKSTPTVVRRPPRLPAEVLPATHACPKPTCRIVSITGTPNTLFNKGRDIPCW